MLGQNDKGSVRYRQFAGGYAQALDSQLMAVLTGYERGLLQRNEVRVFAGRLEQSALHQASNVSLYRIVNCQSQRKGKRRLSSGEIQTATGTGVGTFYIFSFLRRSRGRNDVSRHSRLAMR